MEEKAYPYDQTKANNYLFISVGKKRIVKQVTFRPTSIDNVVNMGFGDMLPGGKIDDKSNSNNGDMVRVLATIVQILKGYTFLYPDVKIFFTGSTEERTRLYSRIVRNYYRTFSKEFTINVLIKEHKGFSEEPFEPGMKREFYGFVIKRKS